MANTCPVVESGSGPKALKAGDYKFDKFCVEPTSFTVKEEKADGSTEFAKTKLMTRLTYTLDAMSGDFKVGSDGSVNVVEKDGVPLVFIRTITELEQRSQNPLSSLGLRPRSESGF